MVVGEVEFDEDVSVDVNVVGGDVGAGVVGDVGGNVVGDVGMDVGGDVDALELPWTVLRIMITHTTDVIPIIFVDRGEG